MPNIRPQTEYSACDYRSDELAKEMLANIIGEKNFDIDNIEWDDSKITVPDDLMSDWKTKVDPVTIDELTERKVKGSGVFDAMMHAIRVHLKEEYDNNRITGAEYATTYTRLTEAALGNAVQFCLQKNQAYFQGILAQAQAITAGIQAQIAALTAKVQLAKVKAEALGVAAQYALTAMKLSTEDAQHALICRQQDVTTAQIAETVERTALIHEQANTQLEQTAIAHEQVAHTVEQTALTHAQAITQGEQSALVHNQSTVAKYQAEMLNPKPALTDKDTDGDYTNVEYQAKKKQMEDQTAQTAIRELQLQANQPETPIKRDENGNPILVNGEPVEIKNGNIDFLIKEKQLETQDAQADLYAQQKIAYERKSEHDMVKVYSDFYTAMKSIDEGYPLPKAFTNRAINDVLQTAKVNVKLGNDDTPYDGKTDVISGSGSITNSANWNETNYNQYLGNGAVVVTDEDNSSGSNNG